MNFLTKPKNNGTVVILGAGASFGALIQDAPPIMRDFIKEGRKRKLRGDYNILWKFLDNMGFELSDLESGKPDLEELYSTLHTISTGLWYISKEDFIGDLGKEFWKITPVGFLESFIVEVTDRPSLQALKKTCIYHDKVVQNLKKGDTIISFNYDLIIDSSVYKNTTWSELGGYGFPCFKLLEDNKDKFPDLINTPPSDVLLLKPHGSLNWNIYTPLELSTFATEREKYSIPPTRAQSFRERLLNTTAGNPTRISITPLNDIDERCYSGGLPAEMADLFNKLASIPDVDKRRIEDIESLKPAFIIPPTIYKLGGPHFPDDLAKVWSNVRISLSTASKIVCIGYSFPNADLQFNTLFRLAIRNNKNKGLRIDIINPDKGMVNRLCRMSPKTKVEHVADSLADYVVST